MADLESEEEFESAESETELMTNETLKSKDNVVPSVEQREDDVLPPTDNAPVNNDNPESRGPEESSSEQKHYDDKSEHLEITDNTQESIQSQPTCSQDKQKGTPKSANAADGSSEPPPKPESQSSGWGWGWGGISNLLTTSVSAVSDSAQSITKGIGSLVTNVEDVLGVPQPEEMVREEEKEEDKLEEETSTRNKSEAEGSEKDNDQSKETEASSPAGLGGLLSGFTSVVQSTGMDLVSGGLDALEAIGRKTVNIISEGDPGLRKKRALLSGKDATLSQMLREAKEQAESAQELSIEGETGSPSEQPVNYSILFDQYEGLVHLEALELLSKECANKVRTALSALNSGELENFSKKIEEIDEHFKEENEEEMESSSLAEIQSMVGDLEKKIKFEKLLKACEKARQKISELGKKAEIDDEEAESESQKSNDINLKEYHETGLHILAELSSITIEVLRKAAELSLLPNGVTQDGNELANMFQRMTTSTCSEFDSMISSLTEKLSQETSQEADSVITSLYLESSNSCSYIQDAYHLLQPVLQLSAFQNFDDTSSSTSEDAKAKTSREFSQSKEDISEEQ